MRTRKCHCQIVVHCNNFHIIITNKFIFCPYDFSVADSMVSNFHLPCSTQLMLVAAFGGYETVMHAYKVAIEEGYRFGTYGDAMLLL